MKYNTGIDQKKHGCSNDEGRKYSFVYSCFDSSRQVIFIVIVFVVILNIRIRNENNKKKK